MFKKNILRAITILIFAAVILTPLIYFRWGVYPYAIPKTALLQGAIEFVFALWLVLAIADPECRPRRTPLLIAGGAFLAALLAAAFLGADIWTSLFSTYERSEGVVLIAHFIAFGLVLTSLWREIPWRKLWYATIGTSILVSVLAWLQLYVPNLILTENIGSRPGATFGNPTFLADYLIFNIFLVLYLIFDARRKSKGEFLFLVVGLGLDVAAIFIGQTRGDILGLGIGLLFFAFTLAIWPIASPYPALRKRSVYGVIVILVVGLGAAFFFTRTNSFWKHVPGFDRFQSIASFSPNDPAYLTRFIALKAAWQGFTERPILGWGPENFNIVFNSHYDPRSLEFGYVETNFDKPHDLPAEYLVTGGVVLALAYLGFLAALVWELWRTKDRLLFGAFISAMLGYLVAELFAFDTIGPLLMFYLFVAFADGAYSAERARAMTEDAQGPVREGKQGNRKDKRRDIRVNGYATAGAIALAAIASYYLNVLPVVASYYQYEGFADRLNNTARAFTEFKTAADIAEPYQWNYESDAAAAVLEDYFNNPGGPISDANALTALGWAEAARDAHPQNAYYYYSLVNFYNEVATIDQKKYTALAEAAAAKALALSPNRQEVYFFLAKTKVIEGDPNAALVLLKNVVALDPKVPDAHFYYGIVAYATNDANTGYSEIEEALALGRVWKNAYEADTSAGFFADSGHLEEALQFYKAAIFLNPDYLDPQIKAGIVYYLMGDKVNADVYLRKAGQTFNFKTSPIFGELQPILNQLGIPY